MDPDPKLLDLQHFGFLDPDTQKNMRIPDPDPKSKISTKVCLEQIFAQISTS